MKFLPETKGRIVWRRNFTDEQKRRIHNRECPNCGKPKVEWNRRTDWLCCSKECSQEFYSDKSTIQSWETTKRKAFKRDNYTCVKCGKRFVNTYGNEEFADTSNLIGDHIIPIAIGGDEFYVDNVQTLCVDCNKIKTKQDMKDIANYRNGKYTVRTKQEKIIQ